MTKLEKRVRTEIEIQEKLLKRESYEAMHVHFNWDESTKISRVLDALRALLR